MKKIVFLSIVLLGLFSVNINAQGLSSISKQAGLINQIMKSADVNEDQATAGAGALFEMAKGKLNAEDFKKVEKAVPNMGKMLNAVPAVGGKSSMLGSAATALTGMPKVQAVFDKMGISQDKVALFTPVIVNYVEKKGGKALGQILGNAFKE